MIVTLWMAMSLNGYIARKNNSEDFISEDSWESWIKFVKRSGCLIWGRKTYEIVKTWDASHLDDLKDFKIVVVSTDNNLKVDDGVEVASSPKEALKILEDQGFTSAVLTGGSQLNSAFAKLKLIDDVIVNLEPVIIGQGIPLFSPENFNLNLSLDTTRQVGHLTVLHYNVLK